MTAPSIPDGPLKWEPRAPVPPHESMAAARAAWRWALRGIELGAYDRDIAAWVTDVADQPSLLALASLVERVRQAGRAEAEARRVEFEVSASAAMRTVLHLMDTGQHAKARDLLAALRVNFRSDDSGGEGA